MPAVTAAAVVAVAVAVLAAAAVPAAAVPAAAAVAAAAAAVGVVVVGRRRGVVTLPHTPPQELADYAERVMSGKYKELAMGGQQTSAALTMLHDAARAGHWLCLKNLHLVVHWV